MRLRRMANWVAGMFFALLLLLVLLMVALSAIAQGQGFRMASLAWQDGPVLLQWQQWQGSCLRVAGDRLQVRGLWPLQLSVRRLYVTNCGGVAAKLVPPPWLPPFDLHIAQLSVPGLPVLAVHLKQAQQQWQLQAASRRNVLKAMYERTSGRWQVQGHAAAEVLHPDMRGVLDVQGHGVWQAEGLSGEFAINGQGMAYQGQAPRGAFSARGALSGDKWQLQVLPVLPLALADGWYVASAPKLQLAGSWQRLTSLQLQLQVQGPQMSLALQLDDHDGQVDDVAGFLQLKGAISGVVPLHWNGKSLRLLPAVLALPAKGKVHWAVPLRLPLAPSGECEIPLSVSYPGLQLQPRASKLVWQGTRGWWQGGLDLRGQLAGAALTGSWQGRIDRTGFSGAPARFSLVREKLRLHGTLSLPARWLPAARLQLALQGQYADYPLSAQGDARYAQDGWAGRVLLQSRLPFYSQGGIVHLDLPWALQGGQWQLAKGGQLRISEGLLNGVLLRPIVLASEQGLMPHAGWLRGRLRLASAGMLAARWQLPPMNGEIVLNGAQGTASLLMPKWQSRLQLSAVLAGSDGRHAASGTLQLQSPLHDDMSRSLNIDLQKGSLKVVGDWRWQDALQFAGEVTLADVDLAWRAAKAKGGRGRWHVNVAENGVNLRSLAPVELDEVAMGIVLRHLHLEMASDLSDWHFSNVGGDVLGGQMTAPSWQWPAAQFQPVTVRHLDLAALLALQNDPQPAVTLTGRAGGVLPLQWQSGGLAIRSGILRNEGMLQLQVLPSAGVSAMAQSNAAVRFALDNLSNLAISELQTRLDMTSDGWLDMVASIKGQHPQQNGPPVILNYTHRENVLELLRSVRMADEISQRVLGKQKAAPLP